MTPDTTAETRIAELEATVEGLTEELVETKERLRLLEAEVEPAAQDGPRTEEFGATKTPATEAGSESHAEFAAESDSDDAESESKPASDDDIIVA